MAVLYSTSLSFPEDLVAFISATASGLDAVVSAALAEHFGVSN